jgi:hypothetical protein
MPDTWVWGFIPTLGYYNPSYLEVFTEAHIKTLAGKPVTTNDGYCEYNVFQQNSPDYSSLIEGLGAFGCDDCQGYGDYFTNAAAAGQDVGVSMQGRHFTSSQLEQWFNPAPQYPMFTPLHATLNLPFQFNGACGTKRYRTDRDYFTEGPFDGHTQH